MEVSHLLDTNLPLGAHEDQRSLLGVYELPAQAINKYATLLDCGVTL